jgi:serine O-acetyltransferase
VEVTIVFRKLSGSVSQGLNGCRRLGGWPRGHDPVTAIVQGLSHDVHTAVDEIRSDVKAVQERDPAATSKLEIVTSYSGLHALWLHRLAHKLHDVGVPIVPRWVSQTNRFFTGVEIHPGAKIGHGLFIDHGSGVVIGETTEIGDNVTMYQGVTLGGTGKQTGKRHPTVGDNVVFGAGAKVLGAVTVGDSAKVGAGSVVVTDVPKNSTVVGNPGRPVLLQGQRVGIPDIDYRHLPDPVAEAVKCLVARIVEMEQELDEIHPERKGKRQEAVRQTQAMLAELLPFDQGAGI